MISLVVVSACTGTTEANRDDEAGVATVPAVTAAPEAAAAARAAFEAYRDALVAGDGATAVGLMTPASLDHVAGLQRMALEAGPVEISARPTADRLMIATLRVAVPPSVLRAGSATELLVYAVEAGLVGTNVAATTVHDVTVDAEVAVVALSAATSPAPAGLRLVRHGGVWRVDLVDALDAAGAGLRELARQLEVTEDDLILELLTATAGRPVGPDVFTAPR